MNRLQRRVSQLEAVSGASAFVLQDAIDRPHRGSVPTTALQHISSRTPIVYAPYPAGGGPGGGSRGGGIGGSGVGLNPGGGSRGASLGGLGMRAMFRPLAFHHSEIRSGVHRVAGLEVLHRR